MRWPDRLARLGWRLGLGWLLGRRWALVATPSSTRASRYAIEGNVVRLPAAVVGSTQRLTIHLHVGPLGVQVADRTGEWVAVRHTGVVTPPAVAPDLVWALPAAALAVLAARRVARMLHRGGPAPGA